MSGATCGVNSAVINSAVIMTTNIGHPVGDWDFVDELLELGKCRLVG
jgi:hypothetical protein